VKAVILASQSSARLAMLQDAGLEVNAVPARVDEEGIKAGMIAGGAKPRDIADALAEAKALKISRKFPGELVIGSDQILETHDGALLDKPENEAQAKGHLRMLSGRTHKIISAVVICEGDQPVWRFVDTVRMTMRVLGDDFIDSYVKQYWDHIRFCVGCYRIEAEGAELFTMVDGDRFSVMGMPLVPVFDYLRIRGFLTS
jgi:septum formation protein